MAERINVTEHERKRRVTHASLWAALACAVVLVVGLGLHGANLARLVDAKMAQQTAQELVRDDKSDKVTSKQVAVPPLVSYIGLTYDEVAEAIGAGAQVKVMSSVKDPDTDVRTAVDIALTGGVANSTTGTPTIHLGLDADGVVVQAGFTTNLRFLGYGSLSFVDAAENYHVIENALSEAGLPVEEGLVKVPEAKAEYAHYGVDGITLAKEDCVFGGTSEAGYDWSGELTYDYAQANAEGNLAYTLRFVTVTVIGRH